MRIFFAASCLLACMAGGASTVSAQTFGIQYGPRAFWSAPVGLTAANVKYDHLIGTEIGTGLIKRFNLENIVEDSCRIWTEVC